MSEYGRGTAAERGYGSKWRSARAKFLGEHPLCVRCLAAKRTTAATVVDHITPHRGDLDLFWDRKNWQPLCKPCHDGGKQAEEKGGGPIGCDEDGIPLDPKHPWNRA